MHDAPSVVYPVGRSRFAGALAALVWFAALSALLAWLGQAGPGWRQLPAAMLVSAGGLAALWGWARSPSGELSWKGQAWTWSAAGTQRDGPVAGTIAIQFDFQSLMLLRFRAPRHRAQWLWLERRSHPALWDDLRRAMHSPGLAAQTADRAKA